MTSTQDKMKQTYLAPCFLLLRTTINHGNNARYNESITLKGENRNIN